MSHDPSLFDAESDFMLIRGDVHPVTDIHGLARFGDPQTSVDAARRTNAGRTRAAILTVLWQPLTAEQIAARLPDMRRDTVITAVSRLKRDGLIEETGETRLSSAGCPRMILRRTPAAFNGSPAAPEAPAPEPRTR